MNNKEKAETLNRLRQMAVLNGHIVTAERLQLMVGYLGSLNFPNAFKAINQALDALLLKSTFFPTVADIVKEINAQPKKKKLLLFEGIIEKARLYGFYGYEKCNFSLEEKEVMSKSGGWGQICSANEYDLKRIKALLKDEAYVGENEENFLENNSFLIGN